MRKIFILAAVALIIYQPAFAANGGDSKSSVSQKAYAVGQMAAACQIKESAGRLNPEEEIKCSYAQQMWRADCMKDKSCPTYAEWQNRHNRASIAEYFRIRAIK